MREALNLYPASRSTPGTRSFTRARQKKAPSAHWADGASLQSSAYDRVIYFFESHAPDSRWSLLEKLNEPELYALYSEPTRLATYSANLRPSEFSPHPSPERAAGIAVYKH